MKGLKIFGFVVVGLVVLVGGLLALAFTPAVQTWAVRKAVARQPGMTLEVARVDAGLSAAEIRDVRYVKDGMVVTAKVVTAKYSAWDYLSKKRLNADSVAVQELVVDLRNISPAALNAPAASSVSGGDVTKTAAQPTAPGGARTKAASPTEKKPPFDGVLKQAQLPFDVRVQSFVANGRALLPQDQSVTFDLKGQGIATGQLGKLEWTIDFADTKKAAPLRALRSTGNAGVHISADRRIDLVEIEMVAAAMGPQLPSDRINLTAKAEQQKAGGNEVYSANVGLLRGSKVEPIIKTDAQYVATERAIRGSWELALRSEQLAGLLTGLGWPEIAANGTGKFNFKPDTNAVSASGDLQGQASQLQKLSPALEAVGAMQFKTTFDGGMANDVARLDKLNLEVTGANGRKFAEITALQKIGYGLTDKKVTLTDPKAELARISLQALPLAWAQPMAKPMVIESGDLSLVLAIEAEPDGSRVRARAVEPLVIRTLTIRDANKKALVEQVTLSTRPVVDYSASNLIAQLAELKVSMPAGDTLSGNIGANVTHLSSAPATSFTVQLQAKIINALKPYLPIDTGPLAANIAIEGRHEGQILQLAKATATVNREGGGLLAALDLQQSVRADLAKSTFAATNPNATAARIKLGQIPLAWAEAFVAKSKFAGTLEGGTLDVTMRTADDLTFTTAEPITLRGVGATLDGKPMAQALDLSANLSATKRGEVVSYDVKRLEAKQGDTSLAALGVTGEAKLGAKMTIAAKGNLEADVAALMKQPMLAEFATLARGRVTAAFEANVGDATQAKAAITAKSLVAKQDNRALGDLEMTLTANVKPDGTGTFSLPLTLTNSARKSDLAINGAFGKATNKETFLFTGKIASNLLVVEDFEPLAGLAPGGEKPKAPTAPKTTRDTAPFWKAVNGKVEMDLKRVLYGKDYAITGVHGTAVITDSKLSLDGLEGRFKENPFKLAGGLTFAASQPKPYTLTASADVQNFDVGEFLRAANPTEKPALETKATVTARLNGTGGTVGDLAKNAFGKFELTGSKGVARYLARKGGAGTAVNLASLGLAVLGAARGSDTATALSELTRLLNEIPFDSVKMQVERGADLSFKLTSMEVLSPVLRTTGSGAVASKGTEDLPNAPMNIVLQLGAKGEMAYLLQRVGMLGTNQDDKGYQLMTRTFTVGGTPSKPDSGALWKLLLEAGVGAFGR